MIQNFKQDISKIQKPKLFTYPFHYQPHKLATIACEEVQSNILESLNLKHDFNKIGKMFGVLIIEDSHGKLGYLMAYSGNLIQDERPANFVPFIYDFKNDHDLFSKQNLIINNINAKIENLEKNTELLALKTLLIETKEKNRIKVEAFREKMRLAKRERKKKRENASDMEKELLIKESLSFKYELKELTQKLSSEMEVINNKYSNHDDEYRELKEKRKILSIELQNIVFKNYKLLNQNNEQKDLIEIFNQFTQTPPAGSGDCAAPKLLQYAFQNKLRPICMAEFWWGVPHKSEIRKHKNYYPSCKNKCLPILDFMLQGIQVESNPMLENSGKDYEIEIIFEDEAIIVLNKPEFLLSVPGKMIKDSVETRIKTLRPNITGPVIVHRLDQDTSGLFLIAKTEDSYKKLQDQFIKRTIKKRYIALLDGEIKEEQGKIELPLRVDLENRPSQLVCYKFGKKAITEYKVIEKKNNQTRIYFYPITGRTHQLRVHAAHNLGLNTPIVGDLLYGTQSKRMCLHAEWIEFEHPSSNKRMSFFKEPNF